MKAVSTLSASVTAILTAPAPVLVVDTCSVLDVTRSLHRPEPPTHSLSMGTKAVRVSRQSPPGLHLIVFDEIEQELLRNLPSEIASLRGHMTKLESAGAISFWRLIAPLWRSGVGRIEATLAAFPARWKDSSHRISQDAACMLRARARLTAGIKPAKRGNANVGDCLITEQLLELAAQLRSGGFSKEIVFVSSNKKDYGGPALTSPLNVEFASYSIDFFQNIQGAMTQLGY